MKSVAISMQKGGVGKTTFTLHLAYGAHEADIKTLVVDFDPQGHTSVFLTQDMGISDRRGGSEMLLEDDGAELPITKVFGNVDLLHGHQYLDAVNQNPDYLTPQVVEAFRRRVASLGYDLVIFDTPPSMGHLHVMPLFCANVVLMPIQPNMAGIKSLRNTVATANRAKALNPALKVRYAVNLYNVKSKTHQGYVEKLQAQFGHDVLSIFKLRVAVNDAIEAGMPVWKFGPKDVGTAWQGFARNVLELN